MGLGQRMVPPENEMMDPANAHKSLPLIEYGNNNNNKSMTWGGTTSVEQSNIKKFTRLPYCFQGRPLLPLLLQLLLPLCIPFHEVLSNQHKWGGSHQGIDTSDSECGGGMEAQA